MKIYVDELPKTCRECFLRQQYNAHKDICGLLKLHVTLNERREDCPLAELPAPADQRLTRVIDGKDYVLNKKTGRFEVEDDNKNKESEETE